jgi:signal peptidase II
VAETARASPRQLAGWIAIALFIALVDQATKLLVLAEFRPGESREITGFLNMVLVFNKGAAFSFLADAPGWQTPLLSTVAAIAIVVVVWMLWRHPGHTLLNAGLTLILAGALGNLVDRLAYGHVVDFIDVHAFGWHWPAFNVADSAITVGAAILIIESFVRRDP